MDARSTAVCREVAGVCDTAESCDGTAAGCPADVLVGSGTTCRQARGDCDAAEDCTGTDAGCPADAPAGNGTACNDGAFCNGADSCEGGSCTLHAGNACPGADGDGNCSETCDEASDACNAPDGNGTACDDGNECTVDDACQAGTCTGDPAPACQATTTSTTLEPGPLCGDANGSGEITAADALIVLRYAVGLGLCLPERCDFNGDGKVSAGDALAVLRTAVGLPTDPNCPPATEVSTTVTTSTLEPVPTTTVP